MPKSLGSFLEDCRREIPNEVVHVAKELDPAHFDVSALIKHLDAARKFPILVFDNPLNLHGKPSEFKLTMNCEISQGKIQVALGAGKDASREAMTDLCLELEEHRIVPLAVELSLHGVVVHSAECRDTADSDGRLLTAEPEAQGNRPLADVEIMHVAPNRHG